MLYEGDINNSILMSLLNATYFKGVWKNKFKKKNTFKGNFEAPDKSSFVEYMKQERLEANVYEDKECKLIELPYGNEAFGMVVVLPNEELSLDELTQSVDADKWQSWMEHPLCVSPRNVVLVRILRIYDTYSAALPFCNKAYRQAGGL